MAVPSDTLPTDADREAVAALKDAHQRILTEIQKVIVGQERVVDELLISIFARGHCLLVGVPGLAKTLLIRTLAESLSLAFNRIQFTPDLMPSDITGTEVMQEDKATGNREFKFVRGPIFANVILADEINRTPPKTQAALLEAMQEFQVTAGGNRHALTQPFFVLATQNPIEQEGTYPLPEAQQDRFMFNILVDYPGEEEEVEIVARTTRPWHPEQAKVLSGDDIVRLQAIVRKVIVPDPVMKYATALTRATRPLELDLAPSFIRKWVAWGAGPRASQYLLLGAKARAILKGRMQVSADDIKAVAHPVLRHRVICNFNAEADSISTDRIVDRLLAIVPAPGTDVPQAAVASSSV
ncbi:MAG: AAA family ATPase [Planctomycetota bacterium]